MDFAWNIFYLFFTVIGVEMTSVYNFDEYYSVGMSLVKQLPVEISFCMKYSLAIFSLIYSGMGWILRMRWGVRVSCTLICYHLYIPTQQDYYGRRCGTLLHSYCTGTYTEVTVLLLWGSSNATLEYPRRYSNRVAVWVLHGNSRVTSKEQHCYFSVDTSAVTVL